ncbi:uncharacterized protein LOC123316542 [Coccinella septempunctata]|uniref:uncharacterized protein LOC123316542 n=1 Tax=Coccinella septempunctata TaxID=41139 RepID=UPI001D098154|nr:uncharacterized protein LOC123316542 [Coccinella septempunctata]
MERVWSYFNLPRTAQETVTIMRDCGLLPQSLNCPIHRRRAMTLYNDGSCGKFRCTKNRCGKSLSGATGSFFAECKLEMHVVFALMYFFTEDMPYERVMHHIGVLKNSSDPNEKISSSTIAAWYDFAIIN